ncbi:MAG: iron ABC transporter permease [Bacteroidota bacterium]|nr:iron ABC transporter permease [Bacteroidota bacterium]
MNAEIKKRTLKKQWLLLALFVAMIVLFLVNIVTGSIYIPLKSVVNILINSSSESEIWRNIIIKSRLPQAITAMFAGAALAISGLQMQTLFRNPLAGPSVLGISAGSSLGVAFVILLFSGVVGTSLSSAGFIGSIGISLAAFLGAMTVLGIITLVARNVTSNTVLLIIGIMVGYAGSSIVGILKFYSDQSDLKTFVIWGLGSFANVTLSQMWLFAGTISIGLLASFLFIKPMNIYLLGERYAQNLGLNLKRTKTGLLIISGFLTAIVTAYTGPIAFIGLAVPHLVRHLFLSSDNKILVPGVIISGAVIALFCNFIARLPGFDSALPINTITSIIGAPVIIWVILKQRRQL